MPSTKISKIIATGFGSGLSPVIPGTAGSAAACAFWCIVSAPLGISTAWLVIIFTALGMWATREELRDCPDNPDPSHVVIDEWAGMFIPLCFVAAGDYMSVFFAFILFRVFDILKPSPARNAEELPGAAGVMLDDIVAGIYAAIFLAVIQGNLHLA